MEKPKFIDNIREFLSFLAGLWGSLSGITLLFPLSNSLFKVIPVGASNLSIFTVIATIASLFALLLTYVGREIYLESGDLLIEGKKRLIREAIIYFCIGFFSIPIYLVLNSIWRVELTSNQTFGSWIVWVIILLLYASVFLFLTNSFTRLALSEYLSQFLPKINGLENIKSGYYGIELGSRKLDGIYLNTSYDPRKISVTTLLNGINYKIEDYSRKYSSQKLNAFSVTVTDVEDGGYAGDRVSIRVYILPDSRYNLEDKTYEIRNIVDNQLRNVHGLRAGEIDVLVAESVDQIPLFT